MITHVFKELLTLPIELFVQDKELAAKLEKGLETAVDTVGFFTGDFSSLFPDLAGDAPPSAEAGAVSKHAAVPAEQLPWLI
ncbi:MAG: hypothetical protein AAGD10_20770 [Myxococcota bacterium]